ncbi:MAG TPA: hypothetical protein VGH11_08200 [Jatrophihabitans sp.]|jgi:hypothetical protein
MNGLGSVPAGTDRARSRTIPAIHGLGARADRAGQAEWAGWGRPGLLPSSSYAKFIELRGTTRSSINGA